MVGVIIIAVVFVALAGGILYGVSSGRLNRLGPALQSSSRSGSRLLNTTLVIIYVAFGICVPLLFIIGNHNKSNAQVGGLKLTSSEQVGRQLFAQHCAVCHTLAADNAVGKTGPNLDILQPPESLVLHTIANGCLQKPTTADNTCLGYGTMPADLLQGPQAADVAAFVARVAGHA